MKDEPATSTTTGERTLDEKVRHWWPGYWLGFLEGALLGAAVASCFFIRMFVQ